MPMSLDKIVQQAQRKADAAEQDVNVIYAQLAAVPPRAALMDFSRQNDLMSFDIGDAAAKGKQIFSKFEKYLKKAVCDDFQYCKKRAEVDANLKKYLPDIVKAILKRIPISGKIPGWLATILGIFGITATSMDILVTLFVAWLIVQGCNALCQCKA